MKALLLAIVINLLCLFCAKAQYQVLNEVEVEKAKSDTWVDETIPGKNGFYSILRQNKNNDYFLQKFDYNLKEVFTTPIIELEKKHDFWTQVDLMRYWKSFYINNKIVSVFSQDIDKNGKYRFEAGGVIIGGNGEMKSPGHKIFSISDYNYSGNIFEDNTYESIEFDFKPSEDSAYLFSYFTGRNKNSKSLEFHFSLLDVENVKTKNIKYDYSYPTGGDGSTIHTEVVACQFVNDKIYSIIGINDDPYHYKLLQFSIDKEEMKEVELSVENDGLSVTKIYAYFNQEEIILHGLYNNNKGTGSLLGLGLFFLKNYGSHGMFVKKVNTENLAVQKTQMIPFDKEFLSLFLKKGEIKRGNGLTTITVGLTDFDKKGDNIIAIYEDNFSFRVPNDNGPDDREYESKDIMIFTNNTNTGESSFYKIPKFQESKNDDGSYNSYKLIETKSHYHFMYNDDAANVSITPSDKPTKLKKTKSGANMLVSFDKNNMVDPKKQLLFSNAIFGFVPAPKKYIQTGEHIILYGSIPSLFNEAKTFKYLKIKLDG